MAYSEFTTVAKVKEAFGITTQEGQRFLPDLEPIQPSQMLQELLEDTVPLAIAVSTEKIRSEGIIAPILFEVRRILKKQISLFSGEDFTVDESAGLNGVCDYLISGSVEQLSIEAPVLALVEAKKGDLKLGMGQCMAEMIAAQRFNSARNLPIKIIYGCVTNGTAWRFLNLIENTITVDLFDYPVPPPDQVIAFLVWMVKDAIAISG